MFTGLAEGTGTIHRIAELPVGVRLSIEPECFFADDVAVGDSIAISGCCLTTVKSEDGWLEFEAGEETLSKTTLGRLRSGDRVNLERALAAGGRIGGHFVQGHVDGTAVVDEIHRSGEWVTMWFQLSSDLMSLVVPKGSVAVDGVSLTVVRAESQRLSVALIPHTLEVTTLGQRAAGDLVNIETDILGKYVASLLRRGWTREPDEIRDPGTEGQRKS